MFFGFANCQLVLYISIVEKWQQKSTPFSVCLIILVYFDVIAVAIIVVVI